MVDALLDGSQFEIAVHTELEHLPITGNDTCIMQMPDIFYMKVDDHPLALAIQPFSRWLRTISEAQASNLGCRLHHAEYIITKDPVIVEARGISPDHPDCESCRDGLRKMLEVLAAAPDHELLVGMLYWTD